MFRLDVVHLNSSDVSQFHLGSTFSYKEWVYLGVSLYKNNNYRDTFNINMVMKTKDQNSVEKIYRDINFTIDWIDFTMIGITPSM